MLHVKFGAGSSSVNRKSRLEGKPSMLPKPRRPTSIDRLSTDNPRPSGAGYRSSTTGSRSSSAEPSRGTFGAVRLSREASATKLVYNGRPRSQTGEARFTASAITPLRTSQFPRPTTSPRTPSDDHATRNWQASLDRVLAFVTTKDQRPISNVAWQRAEYARVSELLMARGDAGGLALIRPLTIAKFVEITGALLSSIIGEIKLNNDNYVTKLPHLTKRVLYPGTVSKSWLRTVNTLHAFPHALALVAYLLDMLTHIETPVDDEWLYAGEDALARLRRDYLSKCWIRFQEPDHQFEDLNEEYVQSLAALFNNNDRIHKLPLEVKELEEKLEDAAEPAARAEEHRLRERLESLTVELRSVRNARRLAAADIHAQRAMRNDHVDRIRALDIDIERASVELDRLQREVESQPMSISERSKLLDEVDYLLRVNDSKRALADQIAKMVLSKESELALWQKKTLDSCVEYKQALIHLSAHFPAHLTVDEKELMEAECASALDDALEALRAQAASLGARRAEAARERTALSRQRAQQLDEGRVKLAELKATIQREQQALDAELHKEASDVTAWAAEERELSCKLEALHSHQEDYARSEADADFWEQQDLLWNKNLSDLREYVGSKHKESERLFEEAREKRVRLLLDNIRLWNITLGE